MPAMKIATILLLLLLAGCAPKTERSTTTQTQGEIGGASEPAPSATDSTSTTPSSSPAADPDIRVTQPTPGAKVTSPLTVWGEAKGPWYFEASFPVKLLDAQGNVLATGPAQAKGEWMTPDFVPFEVTLRFTPPASGEGRLVLEKSNASGLPEHAGSIIVPVKF